MWNKCRWIEMEACLYTVRKTKVYWIPKSYENETITRTEINTEGTNQEPVADAHR